MLLRDAFPTFTLFLSNCLCFFQKRSPLWGWPSHLVFLNSRIFLQTSATKMTKKWSSLLKFASKVPFVVLENRPFRQRWPHWPDLNLIWWQTNLYQQRHLRHHHLPSPGQIQTKGIFQWTGVGSFSLLQSPKDPNSLHSQEPRRKGLWGGCLQRTVQDHICLRDCQEARPLVVKAFEFV